MSLLSSKIKTLWVILCLMVITACVPAKKHRVRLLWPEGEALPQLSFVARYKGIVTGGSALAIVAGPVVMEKPYGVASDGRYLYVTDPANSALFRFDLNEKKTVLVKQGKIGTPMGVELYKDRIFITDSTGNVVIVMDEKGNVIMRFGKGILKRPIGIAISSDGKVFVASSMTHKIEVFSLKGEHLYSIGKPGFSRDALYMPLDLVLDDGKVLVLDSGNKRVQVYTIEGKFVRTLIGDNTAGIRLERPKGIAIDADRNIYITDALRNCFYVFNSKGKFLFRVGKAGIGIARFQQPADIFVDRNQMVFVADHLNGRVQVFKHHRY